MAGDESSARPFVTLINFSAAMKGRQIYYSETWDVSQPSKLCSLHMVFWSRESTHGRQLTEPTRSVKEINFYD